MMYSDQSTSGSDKNRLKKIVTALTERTGSKGNASHEDSNKNFCVEETLTPTDISVTVTSVGQLSFPLNKASVQKLINFSSTAKFGLGEKTVVDKNVRNTQMIESKSLNVTINQESLSRITSSMQKALGLPENISLTSHLHNMLIYGPGQFFSKHRDSEKLENMIATLVIVLPSPHIGGELVIHHGKKKHTFCSENVDEENAKCICFYSDCVHEVKKVKCGYRVALTFNVVLKPVELTDTPCTNEQLKAAVLDYFNTPNKENRPKKIIFFLNHTYSEHSLRWDLLKGEDYQYASKFRSVARELDLDIFLALADIHHCWSSAEEYEPDPDDLIDSDITLDCWLDANNMKLSHREYSATNSEICFELETDNTNFDPTTEEFSEYTGNEGATIDYWYKRATVVLWRKSDLLAIKFELNYDEAMTEVLAMTSVPGNEKKIKDVLDKAALHKHPTANNFEAFVNIALYFKSMEDARAILSSFCLTVLIPKYVPLFIQLQQQYGIEWLIEFFSDFRRRNSYGSSSLMASEAINIFVCEFLNLGGERSVMEYLLNAELTTFIERSGTNANWYSFSHADSTESLERFRHLFIASATLQSVELQEKLAQYLTSQPKLFSTNGLIKLYGQLQKSASPEHLEKFRTRLEEVVKQQLSVQTRPADDWSISTVLPCKCEHCCVLTQFLRSKTDMRKLWPAVEKVRKHITGTLKRAKVPVDITLMREGRPYTMVLVKNATLHTEAAKKCAEMQTFLRKVAPKAVKKNRALAEAVGNKRQKL